LEVLLARDCQKKSQTGRA